MKSSTLRVISTTSASVSFFAASSFVGRGRGGGGGGGGSKLVVKVAAKVDVSILKNVTSDVTLLDEVEARVGKTVVDGGSDDEVA